ncbi:DUF6415 family natural product biosynthesis protein [Streptomyces sp. NPDC051162]|uniref:DUF6415 family natural product biosynthesis protein n=1 Tax=Streptomyces sp. NPDC051162 TaxID=3154747 RepID=UPI0034422AD2
MERGLTQHQISTPDSRPATVLHHVPPHGLRRAPGQLSRAARTWPLQGWSPEAPGIARRLLRTALCTWGVPDGVAEAAETVVSELVTNVVMHTRSRTVYVRAVVEAGEVTVSVTDSGPYRAGEDETVGRGLAHVEALSDRWGYEPAGPGPRRGTRVWATLHLPGPRVISPEQAADMPVDAESIGRVVAAVLAPREVLPADEALRHWHQVLSGHLHLLLPDAEERSEQLRRGRGPTLVQHRLRVIRTGLTYGCREDRAAVYDRVRVMARQCRMLLAFVTGEAEPGTSPAASYAVALCLSAVNRVFPQQTPVAEAPYGSPAGAGEETSAACSAPALPSAGHGDAAPCEGGP